ncbi:hypothetical protein GALMADRAFT_245371 [Galerina marginata CBS 339.88]|uniref:Uncharacterized protein n=1 Tax=Galerina marginata (strain CBS 339.88) TaxID=685588 RepID=A0A067T561_GALM3|nr:hypothetical protein GALMADRAFT_245371 [Galerina marginata CBS 339.88]
MHTPQHSLTSFISPRYPPSSEGSLAQSFRCQPQIENLTYRIGSLLNFLSAAQEILDSFTLPSSRFFISQKQIITLVELARKTLESAGIVLYLWASCPERFVAHKVAYIEMLRMLQANQELVDTNLQRRLRVLLMPLTSHFSASRGQDCQSLILPSSHTPSDSRSTSFNTHSVERTRRPSVSHEARSSSMLPPNEFPHPERVNSHPYNPYSISRRPPRLWHTNELASSSVTRRSRSQSPTRGSRHDADVKIDQENVAPEPVAFRQAPSRQRFGIFLTGKSSMLGNYNRKDRPGRPAH